MIGRLRGVLLEKHPPFLLVEAGGVGYELEAPITTFGDLPEPGGEVTLHCHQVVREDAHALYGFARRRDRDVFRLLLRVSGVGAKLALAVLSGMDADTLARCILEGDTAALARLPGIGKKTAERLVIDLRDRLAGLDAAAGVPPGRGAAPGAAPPGADPVAEAVHALIALGLKPPEATRRVRSVDTTGLACEEIVRRALQSMAK